MRLALLILCCATLRAGSATWYVDVNAGGATHDGLAWATAWTNLTAIAGVNAGDTIEISQGTYLYAYNSPFTMPAGTSGNPVILKHSRAVGHNGLVEIQSHFSKPHWTEIDGAIQDNYETNLITAWDTAKITNNIGIYVNGTVNNVDGNGGSAIYMSGADVQHNVTKWCLIQPPVGPADQSRYGLVYTSGNNIDGIEVAYCLFTNVYDFGVLANQNDHTGFGGWSVHHCLQMYSDPVCKNGELVSAGSGLDCYNNIINRFPLVNCGEQDNFQIGGWFRIYNNIIYAGGNSTMQSETSSGTNTYNHAFFYGNLIIPTETNSPAQTTGGSLQFNTLGYDNTGGQWDSRAKALAAYGGSNVFLTDFRFFNNTIICGNGTTTPNSFLSFLNKEVSGGIYTNGINMVVPTNGVLVYNNLVYGTNNEAIGLYPGYNGEGGDGGYRYDTNGMVVDHNIFSTITYASNNLLRTFNTVAAFNAFSGYANNRGTMPSLANVPGYDFRPVSGAGGGKDLSDYATNMPGLLTDLYGAPRGSAGTWSIGALEPSGLVVHLLSNGADTNWATTGIITNTAGVTGTKGYGVRFSATNWVTLTNGANGPWTNSYAAHWWPSYQVQQGAETHSYGSYIAITNLTDIQFLTNATICFWSHRDTNSYNATVAIGNMGTAQTGTLSNSWDIACDGENYRFRLGWPGLDNLGHVTNLVYFPIQVPNQFNETNWTHYAVVIQCPSNQVVGYYNGTAYATNNLCGVPYLRSDYSDQSTPWLGIGVNPHGGTPQMDYTGPGTDMFPNNGWLGGDMADIRIYNRALSAAEVASIYTGVGQSESSPVTTNYYFTSFPADENPISESGMWTNGMLAGLNWSNCATTGGMIQGRQNNGPSPNYADSTALLTGTWPSNQTVTVHLYKGTTDPDQWPEAEIRLRSAMSANTNRGYEVLYSMNSDSSCYIGIVRWNGGYGNFTSLSSASGSQLIATNGSTLKATIIGNQITAYLNGVVVTNLTDNTYTTGNPGVGFDHNGPSSVDATYGFTDFEASATMESETPSSNPTNYYVSTTGSDSNAGTLVSPFATLTKARDSIRGSNGVVYVRGGTYLLTNALALTSADSGVTWRPYGSETPVLIGGSPISNWVTYSGSVLVSDVSTQGLSGVYFRQLFFNTNRQWLARYPNYDPANPLSNGWSFVDASNPNNSHTTFIYPVGAVPHALGNPTLVQVNIFPQNNFWNNIISIASIDTGTRTITLSSPASYDITSGDRFRIENAFEELDAASEWYLTNDLVYWYPPSAIGSTPVYAVTVSNLVTIGSGASNITFKGFTLHCASGQAIALSGTTNCTVSGNTVTGVGDYDNSAIWVSGGLSNAVSDCFVSDVGSHGIYIDGGTETTLTPAYNFASNNVIHDTGVYYKQGAGIQLLGVGNKASHNLIYACPRFGIYHHGQNGLIEYNAITNVMRETDDGGIIYCEGIDWLGCRGTVIRYNYLANSIGFGFYVGGTYGLPYLTEGIYLDYGTCGVTAYGNIVAHVSDRGMLANAGSYNIVTNNIFYHCGHTNLAETGAGIAAQWTGYATNSTFWLAHVTDFQAGFDSATGAVSWTSMPGMTIPPTNHSFNVSGWTMQSNRFLVNIVSYTNDYAFRYYAAPTDRNTNDFNVYYADGQAVYVVNHETPQAFATWQAVPEDVNSSTGNPLLNTTTWQVSPGSPALTLGFQQIPYSQIGRIVPLRKVRATTVRANTVTIRGP